MSEDGKQPFGTAGPKGEGGLDDATGASGSSGGASMKQTSATVDLSKWGTWLVVPYKHGQG